MVNINDTSNDKNFLQEALLNHVMQNTDLIKSKVHGCLFKLLYDPKNQDKKRNEIVEIMKNQHQLRYVEGTINEYAKRIRKTMVNVFKQEMLADGLESTINSILAESGVVGRRNNGIDPHQVTYNWLWEKKFPQMGWELAKEIATPAFDGLNMVDIETAKRGLNLDVIPTDDGCCIKRKERYCLQVNLSCQGQYLLLINESVEGKFYLLSPSKAFTDVPYMMLSEKLCLPLNDGKKGRAPFFQYDTEGDEYFLAIVTEQPIELSWVHWESDPRDVVLDQKRLEEIFVKVGQQSNSQVFYKRFEVVR